MDGIFLYILVYIYYFANTIFVQHSTAEQFNIKENCRQQLVTQIQSAIENMFRNHGKKTSCAGQKQPG